MHKASVDKDLGHAFLLSKQTTLTQILTLLIQTLLILGLVALQRPYHCDGGGCDCRPSCRREMRYVAIQSRLTQCAMELYGVTNQHKHMLV